jgi:group I intron endonuclease
VYIGYTSKTIDERFQVHCENARWKRNYALADAIRVYGVPAFTVELLLQCETHKEACENEIRLIKELNSILPHGYNMTHGGDGVPMTPEVIAKMAASKRGKITPKMLAYFERKKGTKLSLETRAKLSAAQKGRKKSEEWKRKLSISNFGQKRSAETCAKISMAKKGKPWPQAVKEKANLRGRKWSESRRLAYLKSVSLSEDFGEAL